MQISFNKIKEPFFLKFWYEEKKLFKKNIKVLCHS
jgi:hypothetical protein